MAFVTVHVSPKEKQSFYLTEEQLEKWREFAKKENITYTVSKTNVPDSDK